MSDKNLSIHIRLKFQIHPLSKAKVQAFFLSPYALYKRETERIGAYRVVQIGFISQTYEGSFKTPFWSRPFIGQQQAYFKLGVRLSENLNTDKTVIKTNIDRTLYGTK